MLEIKNKHFELQQVASGIYAAIAKDGGGAASNAGFVDLGDQTLIFDTFNTQQASSELKKYAEEISGSKISWVINSHYHGDHIRGNQVFPSCNILSSKTTYTKMKEIQPTRILSQKQDLKGLRTYICALEKTLHETHDQKIECQIKSLIELENSLPTLNLTLPTITFQEFHTFKGSNLSAMLYTKGAGHSPCDSFLYIPEEKVIFMGDLLFVNSHPSLFEDSDVDNWIATLQELLTWDFNTAIPGHGPVGTKNDLEQIIQYFTELKHISCREDNPNQLEIPDPYKNWSLPDLFLRNLKQLRQLSK
ncbi:Hydroxyacylglutathione hydrolase [Bacillus sp. THAF10]|uniref:MBL fold metallo-hydrolase n=1 Tax=Bacillus sp. THAF10 TaxID=2587848 RepID=UPI001267BCDE|nr:MBL fold metallo-hydrolase [Bacillus sp. THAF10]QFT89645.1 Hydroxyacylglutathione hydrolase [Bacillus sp. THAF10]